MPENIDRIVIVAVVAVVCIGLRAGMTLIGFGTGMATIISVLIGALLIAATLLLKSYPAIGIGIYALFALIIIAALVYVNAYRNL